MRAWWAIGAVVLLSGCLQGTPGQGNNFSPTCPSWTQGTPGGGYSGRFTNAFADAQFGDHNHVASGKLTYNSGGSELPLDLVHIDFHWVQHSAGAPEKWQPHYVASVNGTMEGRIYREDTGEQVSFTKLEEGPNAQVQDVMRFETGYHTNFTMAIRLAQVGQPANPAALHINWVLVPTEGAGRADAAVDYFVSLWYRNC